MILTIEEIIERTAPIAIKHGVNSLAFLDFMLDMMQLLIVIWTL
ncbi:hypothetical protein [Methanobrevibacter sp.]|nr:hypothetical protein [Methanobrevibacter sp.]MDO5824412.1 hypothetical protein [Methanobrevibacter sp.]